MKAERPVEVMTDGTLRDLNAKEVREWKKRTRTKAPEARLPCGSSLRMGATDVTAKERGSRARSGIHFRRKTSWSSLSFARTLADSESVEAVGRWPGKERTMRNLFDLVGFGSIDVKHGLYILSRVREHVLLTEPWDDGWGAANDALRTIWVGEFSVEYTAQEVAVA